MNNPHVHIPYGKIGEYLSFIEDNRLNLEIYFNADTLDSLNKDSFMSDFSSLDYNPSFSIHAPFMDLSPGAVDSKIREVTMFRFSQIMDIASLIRPATIVFHSGYEKWKYALNTDIWLEHSIRTWKEIMNQAETIGTKIAIENIFEDTPDNLGLLAQSMDSDSFGICFDTGHFNLFSKVDLKDWLSQIGPHILEVHLHDNDGSQDSHSSIGNGTFHFQYLFDALKDREGIVYTIEAHSPSEVLQSMAALKNY